MAPAGGVRPAVYMFDTSTKKSAREGLGRGALSIPVPAMLRRSLPLWAMLLLLTVAVAAALAVVSPTIVSRYVKPYRETYTADPASTFTTALSYGYTGVKVATATEAGNADPGTLDAPKEASPTSPVVRVNAITADHYIYVCNFNETAQNSWGSGVKYKIEVLVDGSLVGTAFVGQSTVDDASFEGVTLLVDLGTSIPSSVELMAMKL
jgi:hypothetical protein